MIMMSGSMALEQSAEGHIETTTRQRAVTGNGVDFRNLKAHPQ